MPTDTEVRVQIAVPGHVIDVPMSNHMFIGDCLAELIPFIRRELELRDKDASFLDDTQAHWALRRPFRSADLNEEKTLHDEHILDGSRLMLVKMTPGEKYPPLIDDLAEAISYWLKLYYPAWDSHISQRISLVVMPSVMAIICLLATYWTTVADPEMGPRATVCTVLAVPAVITAALAVVIVRAKKTLYQALVLPLMIITYLLTGTAALLITPRPLGIAQLVVAGATLFTLAIASVTLTHANLRLHYGVATGALIVTAIAGLNMTFPALTAVVASELIALSFAVILLTNTVARILARISLPYVPTIGEDYSAATGRVGDLDAGRLPIDGHANESVFNQEHQIRTAYDCTVGILTGALVPALGACWFMGHTLDNHYWLLFAFALVVSLNLVFRAKSYEDALTQGVLLIGATLFMVAFAAGLIISPLYADNLTRGVLVLAALLAGTIIATIYAVQERRIISPVVNKMLQRFETLSYVSVFPMVAFALDAFSKAQNS